MRETKEAKENEIRAAEEAKRQEALLPDKEKLMAFAQFLQEGVKYPELQSDEGRAILKNATIQIYDIGNEIIVTVEVL